MKREAFAAMAAGRVLFLDGAMGSNLTKMGMPKNICVEAWILEHGNLVQELQRQYQQAGSDIIYAPTFAANRISLRKHGRAEEVRKLNMGLVELSRRAVGPDTLLAGDMTTTWELLEPLGDLEEEELAEVYREQASVLAEAGVDLLVAETMLSVAETEVALRAALEVCSLPVICTLTVQEDGRALFGGTAEEAVRVLQELGASAVGVNCSVGPDQLLPVVERMKKAAKVPLAVKPNAGHPVADSQGNPVYEMTPDEFAGHMKRLVEAGADLVGGCCGTTPEFIRALRREIPERKA